MTTAPPPDAPETALYPDLRDPRLMVAVPRHRRAALETLWTFAARLTRLLGEAREPLIGQIKLAWWRDMMGVLAANPAALPKGEPLLAALQAHWGGQGGLVGLVDAAEGMLLAVDRDERHQAAAGFGARLFALSSGQAGDDARGRRWGLLWGAVLQADEAEARALFAASRAAPAERAAFAPDRALSMLDHWAGAIAEADGARRWRREGLLLLRLGVLGR